MWKRVYRYRVSRVSNDDLIRKQEELFGIAGLCWASATQVVTSFVGEHTDFKSMRSQHYELFAALSKVLRPMRILEIGTSDASFTAFMARVCPNSMIETIDLPFPKTDITFRDKNLENLPNIVFRQMNSLSLLL